VGPRNHVVDEGIDPHSKGFFGGGGDGVQRM